MKLLPITCDKDLESAQHFPCLAIDLGFSERGQTCGMSNSTSDSTFAHTVQAVGNWISDHRHGEVVLILEAPLSASFAESGNPTPRGQFETHDSRTNSSSRRVWYENAGAGMSLSAVHFLREVALTSCDFEIWIHVLEGFCSRYGSPAPDNHVVAKRLLQGWQRGTPLIEPAGHRRFSNLGLVTPNASEVPPAILVIPDGFSGPSITAH